ncbi:Oligoendopeptidase F, plasmid,oligoendopeptidase F,Peptidase family M3 [Chlamydia serpentis]|uniref:Oligopeptidase F n=1 Tax=Chlamydia serpentis TaxID=1967782 RepID=A0A2R8FA43_9CHLA|nr:oligoendopeptidase F [Chlamydia serpentis]SPN73298.1 Oligoendopeptidase F, plasmid,oligoendopeptidase F,Peptidase family M3 [Chlamydia serpentis]
MTSKLKSETPPMRAEVDPANCWDITPLYMTREDWKKDFDLCSSGKDCSPIWPEFAPSHYQIDNPESLNKLLSKKFSVERKLDQLYVYAHLIHDQDIASPQGEKDYLSAIYLYTLFSQEISWIQPALVALTEEKVNYLLSSAILTPYRFYLKKIFRLAPHTGTANEEKILASAFSVLNVSNKAFSSLNDSEIPFGTARDSKGEEHPLSHATASLYMQSPDRKLRSTTYLAQCQRYYDYRNTFANLLNGKVQAHLFEAKARNYASCLEASLFQNNIPIAVYTNLIKEIKKHISLINRYFNLKKDALNLKEFHFYDVYAPITQTIERKYRYEEGVDLVCESLLPLGTTYVDILRNGLLFNRWVDRYENKNKRSGAYSSGCYDSPPYILLNYTGTLYDVSVIAHEAGHSMHTYFSTEAQPYHNAQYPLFLAEIASTFNEMLLMDALSKSDQTKEEKIIIITRTLDTIFSTLFRQTLFAAFEYDIHSAAEQGLALTEEFFSTTYHNLQQEFYGGVITFDPLSALEWARIPHFYYNFYVYQYATGIVASLSFAEKILTNEPGALDLYLNFLKSGGSDFPLNILKKSGLDMTTVDPLHQAFAFITKKIDLLSSLLSKS